MKRAQGRLDLVLALLSAVVLMAGGCGPTDNKGGEAKDTKAKVSPGQVPEAKDHDHSGWWCDEHGVPEEICARCSPKLVAQFKAKGDWCKEHERPDSQCFICHPELEAKFAAQYEAKFGKKPPKPEE
jgi:hypothetical protein